jgi:hypothetical protein
MESIVIKEYVSEYSFRLYDWSDVNLLLRCQGNIFSGGDIDLVFWGVKYLELPLVLSGVKICRPRDETAILYEKKYAPDIFTELGDRTYAVESEGNRFNIIASNFWVLETNSHVTESSLASLLSQNEDVREKYFENIVSNWYKVI